MRRRLTDFSAKLDGIKLISKNFRGLDLSVLAKNEGQLLPFIAIIMVILILFTALQFGLSMAYISRIKIRDALDAAVLSAVSLADNRSEPTYLGEKKVEVSEDVFKWEKSSSNYKDLLVIDKSEAGSIAEEYLIKNLHISGVKNYKILELDIKIIKDPYKVQVHKHRPHTEGIVTTLQENFPRWIRVEGTTRIEIPAPLGGIFGKDKLIVQMEADSRKNLRNIPVGGVWQ